MAQSASWTTRSSHLSFSNLLHKSRPRLACEHEVLRRPWRCPRRCCCGETNEPAHRGDSPTPTSRKRRALPVGLLVDSPRYWNACSRMRMHAANALEIAAALDRHPGVSAVLYPGSCLPVRNLSCRSGSCTTASEELCPFASVGVRGSPRPFVRM